MNEITGVLDQRFVLTALEDALAELEVWRQHARDPEEWGAMRRMASVLAAAQREVRIGLELPAEDRDPAQQDLLGR